ncbi:MAG: hypothetical protein ACT4QF_19280 [Sporichthyaceae bacterium]
MRIYILRPEVAGRLGENTVMDTSIHPPLVRKLHYVFAGWSGSDVVESFPVHLVSDKLARALLETQLSGFELAAVEVSKDEQFERFFPDEASTLPEWHWLRLTSADQSKDVWRDDDAQLCLGERARRVFEAFNLNDCEIVELECGE